MATGATDFSTRTPLLNRDSDDSSFVRPSSAAMSIQPDPVASHMNRNVIRSTAFVSAIFSCLCGGSITAYSLYGHLFQEHLRYTQLQVNMVSIAAELAMYLPVPIFGYCCDRTGPAPVSLFAGAMFGAGYSLAAFTYKSGTVVEGEGTHQRGWPFSVMILSFIAVGMGTTAMYMSAVTTCAKNFGKGKYKGLALAIPMAAFTLSGMWQSQIGSRVFYEKREDGQKGDVDVFKYFMFLAVVLTTAGLLGFGALKVTDEEELIDEAVEELEQSGLLDESAFFHRRPNDNGYGSFVSGQPTEDEGAGVKALADDAAAREEEEARIKTWLLNEETRRFVKDHTMWLLTAGTFLVTGPGEAFLNNVGTIIQTLQPPSVNASGGRTTAATHISIIAISSTVIRILAGTVTDWLAPASTFHHFQASAANSLSSLPPQQGRFTISRVVFLLVFAVVMSIGQVLLASGAMQNHGDRFWIVSALIGSGYGAVFSLVPIIISVIWGVENFGTNWGIVAIVPAFGAAFWGIIYSNVYQTAADTAARAHKGGSSPGNGEILCYGAECYSTTFWAMAISVWIACILWLVAWKGRHGWSKRGIAV